MIRPTAEVAVYLCVAPVDMRKQAASLALLVEQSLGCNVFDGAVFGFANARRDRVKLVAWERNGLVLWSKRLERERFVWPTTHETVKRDEKIELVDGVPVQQWKSRPWNTAEVAERDARLARAADREAARALVDGINASIDEAKAAKAAAQAVIDAVAPTTVPQVWARVKDLARALRDTDNALIGAERGVKALAKYVRDQ